MKRRVGNENQIIFQGTFSLVTCTVHLDADKGQRKMCGISFWFVGKGGLLYFTQGGLLYLHRVVRYIYTAIFKECSAIISAAHSSSEGTAHNTVRKTSSCM